MRRMSYNKKHRPHMTWILREQPSETPRERAERLELERGFKEMVAKAGIRNYEHGQEQ